MQVLCYFFFSSRRRHTRYWRDWSSDVCSSDLAPDHYAPVSCLIGMSASQSSALMPLHSIRPVTKRPEGTFGSLRYAFGGDHPSQTTHQAVSATKVALDLRQPKGRISRMAPRALARPLQSLRPILHIG